MNLAVYLNCRSKAERIEHLSKMASQGPGMPLSLAEDLLCMDLSPEEHVAIVKATIATDPAALEKFFTAQLHSRHQDVSTCALREWAQRTDHSLWQKIVPLAGQQRAPQRVRYSILDYCWVTGGRALLEVIIAAEGVEDLSPAYHALLLQRALQWNFTHDRLIKLARNIAKDWRTPHPENKALVNAVAFLARFSEDDLTSVLSTGDISEGWREIVCTILQHSSQVDVLAKNIESLCKKPTKAFPLKKLILAWPPLWLRHQIPVAPLAHILAQNVEQDLKLGWEFFAGIPEDTLHTALAQCENSETRSKAKYVLGGLLAGVNKAQYPEIAAPARKQVHEDTESMAMRKYFFDTACRGLKKERPTGEGFFKLLADAWQNPKEEKIAPLAAAARQAPQLFKICYINTLQKFQGTDEAALKLLDFIRSSEHDELRAVVQALGGIGTQRATQELVACLTRPNISLPLQLEICQILKQCDLKALQSELRSAIADMSMDPKRLVEDSRLELREALTSLLLPGQNTTQSISKAKKDRAGLDVPSPEDATAHADSKDLDKTLKEKIPNYTELSSEVRRALRTAEFFHTQVSEMNAPSTIDLSPIIDMQYKALELIFRETFEEGCSRVIQHGILQRKLDVIGYARPIAHAMDEFENYIGNLPVVNTIPFFSKFKLRKMLRAICLFRPERRFTLDGLKAFALFFLTFSRTRCQYGLQGVFPLAFDNDRDLAEFCKNLHVFQDFRNRAVHEGLHPEAGSDILGIWEMTAKIMTITNRLKAGLENQAKSAFQTPKATHTPIIERKVS